MLRKFDTWLGKKLFIPPIIRVCQKFKISQDEFATYAFLCFILMIFYYWRYTDWTSGVLLFINILYALFYTLKAGLRIFTNPSQPGRIWFQVRAVNYICIPPLLLLCIGNNAAFIEILLKTLVFQFAVFAKEITTIPPTEIKEKKKKAVLSTTTG